MADDKKNMVQPHAPDKGEMKKPASQPDKPEDVKASDVNADVKKKREENQAAQAELTKKMAAISEQYGGFGSIPLTSEYWDYKTQLQQLQITPIEPSAHDRLPDADGDANVATTTARFGRVPSDNWPPRRANTNWDGVCPDPLDPRFETCQPGGAEAIKSAQDKQNAEAEKAVAKVRENDASFGEPVAKK